MPLARGLFCRPFPVWRKRGYLTTETFFGDKFPDKPWESLAIIGGGAVAAEFAHIFSALGTKVTVIEKLKRLLSAEEEEVSAFVWSSLSGMVLPCKQARVYFPCAGKPGKR